MYCVFDGRMRTAKSYLWLIQFKTQDAITPLLIFNSKVITFTHLFLGYISFLNLCRLFSHIGYAARHYKETHLTIHIVSMVVLECCVMVGKRGGSASRRVVDA